MEISEGFRNFSLILQESIKLLPKNGKLMAAITIISLALPSVFILIYSYSSQLLMRDGQIQNFWILILIELILMIAYVGTSLFCRITTILVSAMSYTGKTLSLQDILSTTKRTMKSQLATSFSMSNSRMSILLFIVMVLGFLMSLLYPNFITISIINTIWILGFIYILYFAVFNMLSIVVSVIEEIRDGKKSFERATELVEGHILEGFVLNVFFNLIALFVIFGYWIMIWEKGFVNMAVFALVVVNVFSLMLIFILVAYTVFYFECKKRRGEAIDSVGGDVQYTRLETEQLVNSL